MPSVDQDERPPPRGARFVGVGALAGGALGLAFSLAVISFADCAGANCTGERVVGVLGHVAGGALLGIAFGIGVWGLWCLTRRLTRRFAR